MKKFSFIPPDSLEYTNCPLCDADKPHPQRRLTFAPFEVRQCTECQLWYLSPRLREEEMLKVYADPNYFQGGSEYGYSQQQGAYLDQEYSLRLTFKKFIGQLQRRNMTGGHLLEMGCGYGFLLEAAAPLFDSVTGTDFDVQAIAQVQKLGYQGIHGGVQNLPAGQRYNVILATGVIEHIYQPLPFVHQLRQHLEAGGWLILATPQMNSFWFKWQGHRWPSFKIPEHVTYYDQRTLTELFRRAGAIHTVTLPYPHAFPLGLIIQPFGISLPARLAKYPVWLPATMFGIAGRFDR